MQTPAIELNVYMGAHRAAGEHLRYVAKSNKTLLAAQNIAIVEPLIYAAALKEALARIEAGADPELVRSVFLLALARGDQRIKRVVLIEQDLCGSITRPTGGTLIYPRLKFAIQKLRSVMRDQSFRVFLGIRSPATFLPSCYSAALMTAHHVRFEDYLGDTDVEALRWSDCIERLNRSLFNKDSQSFDASIYVWRIEDYPMIWRMVFYALTGVKNPMDLQGSSEPLNIGLSLEGARLMYRFLEAHKLPASGAFDKVKAEFLNKFPSTQASKPDRFWTPDLIHMLNFDYEDDWYFIERMENTHVITHPRLY